MLTLFFTDPRPVLSREHKKRTTANYKAQTKNRKEKRDTQNARQEEG